MGAGGADGGDAAGAAAAVAKTRARLLVLLRRYRIETPRALEAGASLHDVVAARSAGVAGATAEGDAAVVAAVEAAVDALVAKREQLWSSGARVGALEIRDALKGEGVFLWQLQDEGEGGGRGKGKGNAPPHAAQQTTRSSRGGGGGNDASRDAWAWDFRGFMHDLPPTSARFAEVLARLHVAVPAVLEAHREYAASTLKTLYATATTDADRHAILHVVNVLLVVYADARQMKCYSRCSAIRKFLTRQDVSFRNDITLADLAAAGVAFDRPVSRKLPPLCTAVWGVGSEGEGEASDAAASPRPPLPWHWEGVDASDHAAVGITAANTRERFLDALNAAARGPSLSWRTLQGAVPKAVRFQCTACMGVIEAAVLRDVEHVTYRRLTLLLSGWSRLRVANAPAFDATAAMVQRWGFPVPDGGACTTGGHPGDADRLLRGSGAEVDATARPADMVELPWEVYAAGEGAAADAEGDADAPGARSPHVNIVTLSHVALTFARAKHPAAREVVAAAWESMLRRSAAEVLHPHQYVTRSVLLTPAARGCVEDALPRAGGALPLAVLAGMLQDVRAAGVRSPAANALQPVVAGVVRDAISRRGFLLPSFEVLRLHGHILGFDVLRAALEEYARRCRVPGGAAADATLPLPPPPTVADFTLLAQCHGTLIANLAKERPPRGPSSGRRHIVSTLAREQHDPKGAGPGGLGWPFRLEEYLHLIPAVTDVMDFARLVAKLRVAIGVDGVAVPSVRRGVAGLVAARYADMEVLAELAEALPPPRLPPAPRAPSAQHARDTETLAPGETLISDRAPQAGARPQAWVDDDDDDDDGSAPPPPGAGSPAPGPHAANAVDRAARHSAAGLLGDDALPDAGELTLAFFDHFVAQTQRTGLRLPGALRHERRSEVFVSNVARYLAACARSEVVAAHPGGAEAVAALRAAVHEEIAAMRPRDVARVKLSALCRWHRYAGVDLGEHILAALAAGGGDGRVQRVGALDLVGVLQLQEAHHNAQLARVVFARLADCDLSRLGNQKLCTALEAAARTPRAPSATFLTKALHVVRARRAAMAPALLASAVRSFHQLSVTLEL